MDFFSRLEQFKVRRTRLLILFMRGAFGMGVFASKNQKQSSISKGGSLQVYQSDQSADSGQVVKLEQAADKQAKPEEVKEEGVLKHEASEKINPKDEGDLMLE